LDIQLFICHSTITFYGELCMETIKASESFALERAKRFAKRNKLTVDQALEKLRENDLKAEAILEHPKIKVWLEECRAKTTRRSYSARIKSFFLWTGKSVDVFLSLSKEEKRSIALQFQRESEGTEGRKNNTITSMLEALNSFLDCSDMKINFKGKMVRRQMDLGSHNFSNGDLTKMFDLGNTKEKALLSLAVSLGWEVSAVLELQRKQLQSYIKRAKDEHKPIFYFMSQGQKTGVPRLGVLNPLALEWAEKWLIESKDTPLRMRKANKITKDRVVSDLFDITEEGANKIMRRLACEAHLSTTGRVHFHKLRGWVISGLSRAGFNEFQIKFCVGKAIPMTDMTYLYGLQDQIEKRYPQAFEDHLNLKAPTRAVIDLSKSLEQEKKKTDALNAKVLQLELRMANVKKERFSEKTSITPGDLKVLEALIADKKALMKDGEV
jgi:integrase